MRKKSMVEQLATIYAQLLNKEGNADYEATYNPSQAVKEIAYNSKHETQKKIKELEEIAKKHNVLEMVKELGDHYYRTNY